jgi:hypothetical protein
VLVLALNFLFFLMFFLVAPMRSFASAEQLDITRGVKAGGYLTARQPLTANRYNR